MQVRLDPRTLRRASLSFLMATLVGIGSTTLASAYPGGTPDFQTDVAPYCAACHASTSADDLAGLGDRATAELATHKHFAAIRAGAGPYAELPEPDRARSSSSCSRRSIGTRRSHSNSPRR